ncbi:MAG: hypothetical protein QF749_03760 [Verrucomicrobiota bacterium]|nr:hypothetical protein [Verrucomicrobiota bacterium]MDP7177387.1 hypothetical protein [Verrucomicrobiota bacterium]MDP7440679.1 hypothetical protein [Verrucomicrobiota bacterium]
MIDSSFTRRTRRPQDGFYRVDVPVYNRFIPPRLAKRWLVSQGDACYSTRQTTG